MVTESGKGLGWVRNLPKVIWPVTDQVIVQVFWLWTFNIMFKTFIILCKKKTGHHQCLDVMTLLFLHFLIPPVCSLLPEWLHLILSYWFSNLRYFLIWGPFYTFSSWPVLFHLPSPSVVDFFKTWLTLNSPSPNWSRFLLYLSLILNSIVRIGNYYFFTDFLIFYHPTKSCLGKAFSFVLA